MTKKTKTLVGLIALFAAVAYVALPYDIDGNWYGYIDDFFVFMAGYSTHCHLLTSFSEIRRFCVNLHIVL